MQYLIIFIVFLITSCAGINPIKTRRPPQFDADVEKTFQELEREKVLDYYFQLRLKDRKNRKSRGHVKIFRPARPVKAPKILTPTKSNPKILVDPQENKIRMEQMLNFHCIKKRNADNCQAFTKAISENCRDEFDLDDQRLIRCIEKKLGK